jgi:CheY-like chemotaxis protein
VVLGDTDIALEKLAVREINPDLIFLGLNPPTMDGRDFLITIKESRSLKEIPVIVLSGSSYLHSVNETKKLGALDAIAKSGKFSELKKILHSILE